MEKFVEKCNKYEMISWTKGDAVHYGIREIGTTTYVKTFAPTKELKGWELRKEVHNAMVKIASQVQVSHQIELPLEKIPVGLRERCTRVLEIPVVCWNPPKFFASKCDVCSYSWMCRVPIKAYPGDGK